MKTNLLWAAIAYILGIVALSCGGILFSTGGSFARWDAGHDIGYFVDMHAHLLSQAGVAICALVFALSFGLGLAFKRIARLEALIEAGRSAVGSAPGPEA